MPRASAVVRVPELSAPPVRLRFVLFFALASGAVLWLYPRVRAAWQLNGLAVALADYGACMAGPTGPGLLRARQLDDFRLLVRRRLLSAGAAEAPFLRCAPLAQKLTESAESELAHRAQAFTFVEYGGNPAPARSLADLAVTPAPVVDAARRAWPFFRGYAALVKPSLGAYEALHPIAPPEPSLGRGLPSDLAFYRATRVEQSSVLLAHGAGAHFGAFESTDGGATFRPVPGSRVADMAERCPAGPDGRSFQLGMDGGETFVVSLATGIEPRSARLAGQGEELAAVACDERALVAAVRTEHGERAKLRQCAFAGVCAPLGEPELGVPELGLSFPLDLARVGAATVIALTMGGVVRVASSRDGGVSWTPFAVVYDAAEHPLAPDAMPTRLLTLGRRVLLHGVAPRRGTYGLLHSDDQGASFRGR